MQIASFHLTYCLNIYAGESWEETFDAIKLHCLIVKKEVSVNQQFALGLRLSAQACQQLTNESYLLEEFSQWLRENNFYVFTINIFPYGQFHQKIVKESVYYPDWGKQDRLTYTLQAIDILAKLLPQGIDGSLSTVPITYGKALPVDSLANLNICAQYLQKIQQQKHLKITLALEFEPDCYLETTDETIDFLKHLYQIYPQAKPYIGICFDTCHVSLQFEDIYQSLQKIQNAQIPIAKIQLSSALSLDASKIEPEKCLAPFAEEVYLHQTKIKEQGKIYSFSDLPQALQSSRKGQWRVHFHLPLYLNETQLGIKSTNNFLTKPFFTLLSTLCPYLEIETYTFDVFPECNDSVDNSIIKEITFVKEKLSNL